MKTVKVGSVGLGRLGYEHAKNLATQVPGCELAAICDVDANRVKEVAAELGVPNTYTDFEEMCKNPELDAIVIVSPSFLHCQQIEIAMNHGKHVFCEKPLGTDVAQCKAAEKVIEAHPDLIFQLGFMRRFDPDYIKMKKILDSGELGAPLMAHCISRTRSHPKNHTTEQHITNIAIHEIDICRWLLGENLNEVAVRFPRATCFAEGTCQDPQLVLMQSDSGVLIDVEVSGNSYYGYEILCELVCEKGTIRLPVAAEPIVRSYLQCGQAIPEDWTNRFVVAYQEELQYWVDYLQGKTDVPGPGAEDGYEACKISDALIKAQTTGQWEKVEA